MGSECRAPENEDTQASVWCEEKKKNVHFKWFHFFDAFAENLFPIQVKQIFASDGGMKMFV